MLYKRETCTSTHRGWYRPKFKLLSISKKCWMFVFLSYPDTFDAFCIVSHDGEQKK